MRNNQSPVHNIVSCRSNNFLFNIPTLPTPNLACKLLLITWHASPLQVVESVFAPVLVSVGQPLPGNSTRGGQRGCCLGNTQ